MGRWQATWDPETMVQLETKIDNQLQAMFHDRQPEGCPTDLLEKQSYLRALAVVALIDGHGGRSGKPEVIVAGLFHELQKWASQRDFFGSGFTRVAIELAEMPGHPAAALDGACNPVGAECLQREPRFQRAKSP